MIAAGSSRLMSVHLSRCSWKSGLKGSTKISLADDRESLIEAMCSRTAISDTKLLLAASSIQY